MTGESQFVSSVLSLSCSAALLPLGVAQTAVNSSVTGGDVSLKMTSPTSSNCPYYNNLFNLYFFNRPFRRVTDKGALLWDRIHRLEKGKIYQQVAQAN